MAKFYGLKILKEGLSIENVPKRWRAETEKWLEENCMEKRW